MKLISTVYKIKEEFIPKKLFVTKIQFDEKKIQDLYTGFVYGQVSNLSHKLSNKDRLVTASGMYLVSEEQIDKDEIEMSFDRSEKLYSNFYKGSDKSNELSPDVENWLSYCKPYVHKKVKQQLLDNKYIPIHFLKEIEGNHQNGI